MNPLAREWFAKAEGDIVTARRELRARKVPNDDAACFHAQQCAEKLLKAALQEANVPFGKTHNLIALLELLLPTEQGLEPLRPHFEFLTAFSVQCRYPGDSADRSMARDALKHCEAVRPYFSGLVCLEQSRPLRARPFERRPRHCPSTARRTGTG